MLVRKHHSIGRRVVNVLAATLGVTVGGVVLAWAGGTAGLWAWPPQPSSPFGVTLGFLGGAIVLFEMALLPRKWLRGFRLLRARWWMWWHIWLGLVCLPVIVVHAGFGFGGPLSAWTLALFLLVIASGVWGLIVQQWLPSKILAEIPNETVASQVDFAIITHCREAMRIVDDLVSVPPEDEAASVLVGAAPAVQTGPTAVAAALMVSGRSEPIVTGRPAAELQAFSDQQLIPYLEGGRSALLRSRAEAEIRFARLRAALPDAARPGLDRLQQLADLRRQWDSLRRLNFWLHNWLVFHLPLSVAMTGLMLVHAVRALKYW